MSLIHLPKSLTAAEKAPPDHVKLTRDIMPQEALQLIANQQGKMVRLLMFLNEYENRLHVADEQRQKATHIAAKHAARSKALTKDHARLLREHAQLMEEKNKLADQLTWCGRAIAKLFDMLAQFTPIRIDRILLTGDSLKQDGREVVFFSATDKQTGALTELVVELCKVKRDDTGAAVALEREGVEL